MLTESKLLETAGDFPIKKSCKFFEYFCDSLSKVRIKLFFSVIKITDKFIYQNAFCISENVTCNYVNPLFS